VNNAILIVDDNADRCRTLTQLLRHMGFQADCPLSGADALSQLQKTKPALILLDYEQIHKDVAKFISGTEIDPKPPASSS
jgi:CheY-like chemotaxis protein